MDELQLISDIWDFSQYYNRFKTIDEFKQKFHQYTLSRPTRDPIVLGDPKTILTDLKRTVIDVFGLRIRHFEGQCRDIIYVFPRHIFHKIAVDIKVASLTTIAKYTGGRDHTTVISSHRRATTLIDIKDELFIEYWHKFLKNGDKKFTKLYARKVQVRVYKPKEPTKYQTNSAYGISYY